ncbi:hypothetical protein DL89DRAFT_81687 [Linderina pennispora]|uniref:PHD-type domain-containing protein n=1 Tax=Linderina pennispora TaxID=61395 RepID=A0A1Y1WGL8_9FUNG|nr:uncharacterized protein DL89DRAFT_81687 [Linderina pennispora]ORX72700.1 hypothetical protein DL89DRAFT_81687 [Linderina pennispora]
MSSIHSTPNVDYNAQAEDLWRKLAIGLHGTTVATSAMTKSAVIGPIARFAGRSRILSDAQGETSDSQADTDRQKSIVESLPRCAFCGDADPCDDTLGGFVNNQPFILTTTTESGSVRRQRFWAHYACAKYSPEVLVSKDNKWYNVAVALRRARTIKCAGCKQRGASIGCFYERCQRSYHVACTDKPLEHFENGRLFWCRKHANGERARYNKTGTTHPKTAGSAYCEVRGMHT